MEGLTIQYGLGEKVGSFLEEIIRWLTGVELQEERGPELLPRGLSYSSDLRTLD